MIERSPKYYRVNYQGERLEDSPFYQAALSFDRKSGDYGQSIIDNFNQSLQSTPELSKFRINPHPIRNLPKKVVIIDASSDRLPTSPETARVIDQICRNRNYPIVTYVVDTKEELFQAITSTPKETLILSQCVDKNTYNVNVAWKLEELGCVIVPGDITAPGGIFSDKEKTYRLLSENGTRWDLIPPFERIEVEGISHAKVAENILDKANSLADRFNTNQFFIKPPEGGGGLGGFRLIKMGNGYILPDLSKVSGISKGIHPSYINIDANNTDKLEELTWIFRLFWSSPYYAKTYLWMDLPSLREQYHKNSDIDALRAYIISSNKELNNAYQKHILSKGDAANKISESIESFEKKFKKRYIPIVCKEIDFGSWGLRAHLRLSRTGPKVETIYSRIFQIALTPDGIGYVGSDNISNKQTGVLEILRLQPVNKFLVNGCGGISKLNLSLRHGIEALTKLVGLLPNHKQPNLPVRIQVDLSAPSAMVCEGNADTARGFALASRWSNFVNNTEEWFLDSLSYYSWKKSLPR